MKGGLKPQGRALGRRKDSGAPRRRAAAVVSSFLLPTPLFFGLIPLFESYLP